MNITLAGDEAEVLASFLNVSEALISTWSDGSLTVGNEEYWVVPIKKRVNKWHAEFLATIGEYNIYKTY